MDEQERGAEDRGYVGYTGSVWSPKNIAGGLTGVGVLAAVLGIVSLVLALLDAFPLITWLLAIISIISGLRVFLPRVTTVDKVLIGIGVLASLAALVVLTMRLASP
jgi:hypothetical protein